MIYRYLYIYTPQKSRQKVSKRIRNLFTLAKFETSCHGTRPCCDLVKPSQDHDFCGKCNKNPRETAKFMMIYDDLLSYPTFMMIYDDWWFMMIYDYLWWFMMIYDDLWWFMMIYDDLLSDPTFMMIDDLWWFMLIYDDLLSDPTFVMIYDDWWFMHLEYNWE